MLAAAAAVLAFLVPSPVRAEANTVFHSPCRGEWNVEVAQPPIDHPEDLGESWTGFTLDDCHIYLNPDWHWGNNAATCHVVLHEVGHAGGAQHSSNPNPMSFTPTPEQTAAVAAAKTGENLVITACAGSGKTSTLRLIADALAPRKGCYIAYNKAIATDAAKSFPANVVCRTAHSLRLPRCGPPLRARLRAQRHDGPPDGRNALGIDRSYALGNDRELSEARVAGLVMATVGKWCHSADPRSRPSTRWRRQRRAGRGGSLLGPRQLPRPRGSARLGHGPLQGVRPPAASRTTCT
jgi:hypothetical protein